MQEAQRKYGQEGREGRKLSGITKTLLGLKGCASQNKQREPCAHKDQESVA